MNKFTIGFDARMWSHPGIGRYIRELTKELVLDPLGSHVVFLVPEKAEEVQVQVAEAGTLRGASLRGASLRYVSSPIYSLSEQVEIPLKSRDFDLLHVPHFNIPVLFKRKLVVTVHDLIYFHDPKASKSPLGRLYTSFLLKMIAKKAAAVIAVSEYTKKDLLENFSSLRPEQVFVTYEAVSPIFHKMTDGAQLAAVRKIRSLEKPFVLYVGSLKAHKNIPMLIRAMDVLRRTKKIEHELVLVGRHDPKNGEAVNLLAKHSFVRYLGELSDSDLVCIYNLADLFVLPSFWEGFGLPVLEAMACGVPVAASNRASLPEVVGRAGLLFDPASIDGLSEVIYNILSNNELRNAMIEKGFEQVKRFSWKNTTQETLHVYKQVLGR